MTKEINDLIDKRVDEWFESECPQPKIRDLVKSIIEEIASRESRLLSAVPSDVIHKGSLKWFEFTKDDDFIQPARCHRDFEEGAKWAIQKMMERGIVG